LELSWHPLLKSDRDVNKACQLVTIVDHNSWMIFSKAPPQTKLPIDWLYVWRTTIYNDHPLMKQMFLLSLVDVVILSSGNIVLTPRITRLSKSQSSNYIQLRIPKYWEDSFHFFLKSIEDNYYVQVTRCYNS
jgi:hypothetical protein